MSRKKKPIDLEIRELAALADSADWPEARAMTKRLLARAPDDPRMLALAGRVAMDAYDDAALAVERLERAAAGLPSSLDVLSYLYKAKWSLGDADGALEVARRLVDLAPTRGVPYYNLAKLDPRAAEERLPAIQAIAVDAAAPPRDRAAALAALGYVFDRNDDVDNAVAAFMGSKQLVGRPFDADELAQAAAASIAAAAPGRIEAAGDRAVDERRLVFIVGLPRSGSSLVERILGAHPAVAAAGERPELLRVMLDRLGSVAGRPEGLDAVLSSSPTVRRMMAQDYIAAVRPYLRKPDAEVWIDKMPCNFFRLGAAAALFPNARFIITRREPRDVFVSSMKLFFAAGQAFTETFERFAQYHAIERAFASFWLERLPDRVVEVSYEAVTADVDGAARRLVAHLRLDWRDDCAAPHLSGEAVVTSSAMQVRAPVNQASVGRWRRYERPLAPLDAMLNAYEAALANAA